MLGFEGASIHDSIGHERRKLATLNRNGDMLGLERYCQSLIARTKADLDGNIPSVYEYLGVAQYRLGRLKEAASTFQIALDVHPDHGELWMHLGTAFFSQLRVLEAIHAFETAIVKKKLISDVSKLFQARNWVADWKDREAFFDRILSMAASAVSKVKRRR
jgi:tetratricopeptide (TPR) repeat protein